MTRSPSFQFYPSDWTSGSPATMTPDETHVYVWLLCREWTKEGFEFDPIELAKWCRLTPRKFEKAWENVKKCFVERNGRLYNPRLDRERQKQAEWRAKSAVGGHMSAESKRLKLVKGGTSVVEPPYVPNVNTSVFSLQSSVSSSSSPPSGVEMLMDLLPPSRRLATAATVKMWEQGLDLPAGMGVPTSDQIDTAFREAAASRDVGTLGIDNLRNFLIRVMERGKDGPKRPSSGRRYQEPQGSPPPRGPSPPVSEDRDGVLCHSCGTKETHTEGRRLVPKHKNDCPLHAATAQVGR